MIKWILAIYPLFLILPLWFQNTQITAQLVSYQRSADSLRVEQDSEIIALEDSLVTYKSSLDSLWGLHPYFNEESLIKLYSFVDKYQFCPGTRFVTKEGVNPEMHPAMYKTLASYAGPPATITSLYRPRSYGSDHKEKLAADIRWNEAGKLLAEWLITKDGAQWIAENNLTIHFENIPDRKYRVGIFEQFYMWNPKATGPHIHISVNTKNKYLNINV